MDEKMLEQLAEKTGLPKDLVVRELKKWILEKGESPQGITLEGLRSVLVKITQDLFSEWAKGEVKS